MSTLAVIATFYQRPWAIWKMRDALVAQSRPHDRLWLLYEEPDDYESVFPVAESMWYCHRHAGVLEIESEGRNPLSVACNLALDLDESDYITYLTDDSLPDPRKYEVMAKALDDNPGWGAVYCSQDFGTAKDAEDWLAGGSPGSIRRADDVMLDPFCRVDHTQVMHRRTNARWPLDYGSRRLSDAHFFRDLVADLGPMYPVPEVLDWTRQLPDGLSARA